MALVDVDLPDMSGFDLCRRIKARPHMAGPPVVHFSAATLAPADRCQGLDTLLDLFGRAREDDIAMPAMRLAQ